MADLLVCSQLQVEDLSALNAVAAAEFLALLSVKVEAKLRDKRRRLRRRILTAQCQTICNFSREVTIPR